MSAPPTAPPTRLLYDAQRDSHYVKPTWRGWLHLVWFELSLIFGVLLLAATRGAEEIVSVAVYVCAVSGLFGASALYHRGTWSERTSGMLQRLDNTMIVVLVAGTATPVAVLAVRGTAGYLLVALIWLCALAVGAMHLLHMEAPELVVGGVFIGLGVLSALGLPALWDTAGHAAGWLVTVGGAIYIGGAVAFHLRRPDPRPLVFGYHEVFHALVCVAASCHFVAIALLVASR